MQTINPSKIGYIELRWTGNAKVIDTTLSLLRGWINFRAPTSVGKNRFESIRQAESIPIDSTSESNTGIFDSVVME